MLKSYMGDLSKFLEITFLLSYDGNKWSRFKHLLAAATFFVLLMYGLVAVCMSGLQGIIDGPGFLNFIGLIVTCHQIFSVVNRDVIKKMLNMFDTFQKRYTYPWEKEIFVKESNMAWNLIYYYSSGIIGYELGYHILPAVADSTIGYFYPNFPSISVPKLGQNIIDLTEPRTLSNMLLISLSMIWSIFGTPSHVGGQGLLLVPIAYMRAELKIIKQRVVMIKEVLEKKDEEAKQTTVKILLKDAIIHHQIALKGLKIMNEALGFPMVVEITVISLCICVNLCGIAFVGNVSIAAKIQAVFANVLLVSMLFCSCLFGESLEHENNQLFQSIYDLPWFDDNMVDKNTMNIMMMQARKPFVVNFYQIGHLKLHTFMQVVNTSYSYFMVLKTTISGN